MLASAWIEACNFQSRENPMVQADIFSGSDTNEGWCVCHGAECERVCLFFWQLILPLRGRLVPSRYLHPCGFVVRVFREDWKSTINGDISNSRIRGRHVQLNSFAGHQDKLLRISQNMTLLRHTPSKSNGHPTKIIRPIECAWKNCVSKTPGRISLVWSHQPRNTYCQYKCVEKYLVYQCMVLLKIQTRHVVLCDLWYIN